MEKKLLNNGYDLPYIGLGTWPIKGLEMERVMETAMEVGYRLFDTADNYFNEDAIGNVIQRNPSLRNELRIMTKISDEKFENSEVKWSSKGKYFYKSSSFMQSHTAKDTVEMLVHKSLKNLRTDYIDALIIHWPYADYILEIWETMVDLYKQGVVKSIGVSNFGVRHLKQLEDNFDILPMINQISISPLDTKKETTEWCKDHDIQVVCYAPMKMASNPLLKDSSIVKELCKKYKVSPTKLLLLWNISQDFIPIPKTTHKERMIDNLCMKGILDSTNTIQRMSMSDIQLLNTLNRDIQYLPESKFCPGL